MAVLRSSLACVYSLGCLSLFSEDKWLEAHYDPVASLYTFTQCITLSDISADGDHKLIIADLGTGTYDMKLKVYKGTSLMTENAIIDLPTGVVTFYMDTNEPHTPGTYKF
jgi:Bardet-Biedl syndrome 1 protein